MTTWPGWSTLPTNGSCRGPGSASGVSRPTTRRPPRPACYMPAARSAGFDLQAACSGFLFGLATGSSFIRSGMYRRVLLVGVEVLSRFMNWSDRNTCVLVGAGAGAVLLEASAHPGDLIGFDLYSDGTGYEGIIVPAGGSACPASPQTTAEGKHFIQMAGAEGHTY